MTFEVLRTNACRNCHRPISLVEGIGWLHEELPQYADEPITDPAAPVDDEDYSAPKDA